MLGDGIQGRWCHELSARGSAASHRQTTDASVAAVPLSSLGVTATATGVCAPVAGRHLGTPAALAAAAEESFLNPQMSLELLLSS